MACQREHKNIVILFNNILQIVRRYSIEIKLKVKRGPTSTLGAISKPCNETDILVSVVQSTLYQGYLDHFNSGLSLRFPVAGYMH